MPAEKLQHRCRTLPVLILLLLPGNPAAAEGLTFHDALAAAEANTPQLQARHAEVAAAAEAAPAADSLPDPKAFIGLENLPVEGEDRFSTGRDFMTMRTIGVMQDVPNAGKRTARAEVAQAQVEQARARLRQSRVSLQIETATAWLNRHSLDRQVPLLDALDRESRLLSDVLTAQLSTGRGRTTDVLSLRQEALALADRRDALHRDMAMADAALRRWVGDATPLEPAGAPPTLAVDADRLRQHVNHHPDLMLFQPLLAEAKAGLHEADAARLPDWGVALAYQNRGAAFSDMVSLQVTMDLPVFARSRQNPLLRSRQQFLASVEAERDARLREHRAQLEADLADYIALGRQLRRLQADSLPLAQQRVDLQLLAYRRDQGELAAVLGARRDLYELRLQAILIENRQQVMAARLMYQFQDREGTEP